MTLDAAQAPDGARRALALLDRPIVVDLVELTLNHGLFVVRAARNLGEADLILSQWAPDLAVVDMDHDDSTALLQHLGASNSLTASATPVLGLTPPPAARLIGRAEQDDGSDGHDSIVTARRQRSRCR